MPISRTSAVPNPRQRECLSCASTAPSRWLALRSGTTSASSAPRRSRAWRTSGRASSRLQVPHVRAGQAQQRVRPLAGDLGGQVRAGDDRVERVLRGSKLSRSTTRRASSCSRIRSAMHLPLVGPGRGQVGSTGPVAGRAAAWWPGSRDGEADLGQRLQVALVAQQAGVGEVHRDQAADGHRDQRPAVVGRGRDDVAEHADRGVDQAQHERPPDQQDRGAQPHPPAEQVDGGQREQRAGHRRRERAGQRTGPRRPHGAERVLDAVRHGERGVISMTIAPVL